MFIFISGTQQTKKKILLYTIVHVCALYNGTALSGRVYVHVLFWGNHTIIINSLSWYHRIWYFLYLITWTNFYTHTYLDSTEWMRYCVCVCVCHIKFITTSITSSFTSCGRISMCGMCSTIKISFWFRYIKCMTNSIHCTIHDCSLTK